MDTIIGGHPIHKGFCLCVSGFVQSDGVNLCTHFLDTNGFRQSAFSVAVHIAVVSGLTVCKYNHDFFSLNTVVRAIIQHLSGHLQTVDSVGSSIAGQLLNGIGNIRVNTATSIITSGQIFPGVGIILGCQKVADFAMLINLEIGKQILRRSHGRTAFGRNRRCNREFRFIKRNPVFSTKTGRNNFHLSIAIQITFHGVEEVGARIDVLNILHGNILDGSVIQEFSVDKHARIAPRTVLDITCIGITFSHNTSGYIGTVRSEAAHSNPMINTKSFSVCL